MKDLARCIGLPTSYGSPLVGAGGTPETVDDTTVARLRAAGAIPIGKSNSPAYGWTAATFNPVLSTTRNPWNLERSPGGSSGGSAATARGGSRADRDVVGRRRISARPTSMCGLVGWKPTIGAVGRDGAPGGSTSRLRRAGTALPMSSPRRRCTSGRPPAMCARCPRARST